MASYLVFSQEKQQVLYSDQPTVSHARHLSSMGNLWSVGWMHANSAETEVSLLTSCLQSHANYCSTYYGLTLCNSW